MRAIRGIGDFWSQGIYLRALNLLRESAAKLPENFEVHYHLGMAAYKVGDLDTARRALAKAVASPSAFLGRDEAASVLSAIK